jgi:hypothetical protein
VQAWIRYGRTEYAGKWVTDESSGYRRVFDSVFEFYTVDDFRQLVLTAQSPLGLRRRHYQFEHHETRGVLRQRALHADDALSHVANTLSIGFEVRNW